MHKAWTIIFSGILLLSLVSCSSGSKKKGTLCSADNDCGGSLCLAGECAALTRCNSSVECGEGHCAGGYCFQESCKTDTDCPYGTCFDGYCVRESFVENDMLLSGEDATVQPDSADTQIDTQIPLTKLVACNPNDSKPENSEDKQEMVQVNWDPLKQAYDVAKKCGWTCLKGFCNQGGEVCLKEKKLPCDPNNNSPLNAIDSVLDVVVQCLPDGSFEKPDLCQWICDLSFCKDSDLCTKNKTSSCDPNNNNPVNSLDALANVVLQCLPNGTFEKPNLCEWTCETNFCRDQNLCVTDKKLPCAPNAQKPLNALDKVVDVVVNCLGDGSFEKPNVCDWICDATYCRDVDQCTKVKTVQCDPDNNNPINSLDLVVDVALSCLGTGNFEQRPPCEWICDNGYVKNLVGDACELAKENCYQIKQALPSAIDGPYYIDPDGPGSQLPYAVWCDMTSGGVTVEYGIGLYNGEYDGWTVVGSLHFVNPVNQVPFIALYNANMGLHNLQPGFTPLNCCFKNDNLPTGTLGLQFGGKAVNPADDSSLVCGTAIDVAFVRFGLQGGSPEYPLLPGFFASNLPTGLPGCTENSNPAFFWKRSGSASCADLKALGFPSGSYELRDATTSSGHRLVYCDMLGSLSYEFGVGAGEIQYTGWSIVELTSWQLPALMTAFLGYYNANDGLLNLDKQLTARGTCCFRTPTGPLAWGLSWVAPYTTAGGFCDKNAFTDDRIHVGLGQTAYSPPPLPQSFFITNPPATTTCDQGDYFAIFGRIVSF